MIANHSRQDLPVQRRKVLRQGYFVGYAIEVITVALAFDQSRQVGRIGRRGDDGQMLEALDLQALRILVRKTERSDELIHLPFSGPLLDEADQAMRNSGIVDAIQIKEARGRFAMLGIVARINDSHDPAHRPAIDGSENSDRLAVGERGVLFRVVKFPFVGVNRWNPIRIAAVELLWKMDESTERPPICHLVQGDGRHVFIRIALRGVQTRKEHHWL